MKAPSSVRLPSSSYAGLTTDPSVVVLGNVGRTVFILYRGFQVTMGLIGMKKRGLSLFFAGPDVSDPPDDSGYRPGLDLIGVCPRFPCCGTARFSLGPSKSRFSRSKRLNLDIDANWIASCRVNGLITSNSS